MRHTFCAALVLIGLFCPAAAHAQGEIGGPDPAKVRVRIGALWMNPTIAISNIGVDQNVFNDPPDRQPKEDFTATLTPKVDLWMHMGRSWLSGSIDEEFVWFETYSSERSANNRYGVGWRLPASWFNVNLTAKFAKVRDRPGYEIDLRAARKEFTYTGLVEGRIMSKTFFGVRGERETIDFDDTATFGTLLLRDQLNHVTTSGALTLRQQVTPLTSIEFNATRSEDQFDFEPLRNSTSTSFGTVITLDPLALIKGSAAFGYRDFQPESPEVPDYSGGTMALDLTYTLLGMTQFAVRAMRDVEYSFDLAQPYNVQTGVDASVSQQIFGPVDVVFRLIEQRLDYRNRAGFPVRVADRTDAVHSIGVGAGYRLGRDLRLGFNVDKARRTSEVDTRPYEGLKYGASLTYGL